MRFPFSVLAVLAACLVHSMPARADHEPTIIVPGNPNIPVIIDGYDVSWGVAEGDWGLYRPGQVSPVYILPYPAVAPYAGASHYFPFTGRKPQYGRREINPPANRPLPKPAESFHRYWMAPPDLTPATISEYPNVPLPPVVVVPKVKY